MIDARLDEAEELLNPDNYRLRHPRLALIQRHYRAVVAMARGEDARALRLLDSPGFRRGRAYERTCPLKVTALVHRSPLDTSPILKEMGKCFRQRLRIPADPLRRFFTLLQGDATFDFSVGSETDILFQLHIALHFWREDQALDRLPTLPDRAYAHPRIREAVGFLFYRANLQEEARRWLEGLNLPNARRVRGNRAMARGDFAQALDAFSQDPLSSSSALRIPLLAFLTGKPLVGIDALESLERQRPLGTLEKLLHQALLTEKGEKNLTLPPTAHPLAAPLLFFNSGSFHKSILYAAQACAQDNTMACASLLSLSQRVRQARLTTTLGASPSPPSKKTAIDLEALFTEEPPPDPPARPFMEQKDIERLDDIEHKRRFYELLHSQGP